MKTVSIYALLVTLVAVTLAGCSKPGSETGSTPPGGAPPASTSPSPPGPAGATGPSADATPRSPGQVGSDAVMTAKVKNALITSKVDTGHLNVDTENGMLTLRGSVPTAAQKALAEKVAKQVEGVTAVKNRLTVGKAR